ncbi:caspase-8 [Plectropomus leopardus]|uniref:caspase-8 n=1 Tax=Plectropomus leopardus TaxID=160734 RepID=UPI001C4D1BFC|nr:caspase-8 [Plectropomus leopardus]
MDFQKLLLEVGRALGKDEVKALAFLCTDLLGRSPTSVESASDLFSRLAHQDHLSAERPHLLTELLLSIQRPTLIRDLKLTDQASTTTNLISPFRKLLYDLSEEITDDDLKDVKFLLVKKLPRRKLEENVTTLEVFLEMEHMDLISDTNLDLLETIIKAVCPMLQDRIVRFKAQQVTQTSPVAEETGRPRAMTYPFEPNQAPQSLDPERTTSCEMSDEFRPLAESSMNTSNTSVDFPNVCHGVDEFTALSHSMGGLSTESGYASLKGRLSIEVSEMPPQENKASPEKQITNTNVEDLGTYPMTAAKRGICLIINNYNFTNSINGLQKREGTVHDEECLHKVFEWLGFEVEVHRDCMTEKMLSLMCELGRRNHSQMDCLVCCILSHGKEGSVYGVDGQTVKIKDLKEPVNALKCTSLAEKPKLFFIQACQGTCEQTAVSIEADGPSLRYVCNDAVKANESIPCDADFLLGMATVPSFVSYRERKNGTWFIQSLCQNLVNMVPRGHDLLSILTKVNSDVSQKTDCHGKKKQMPQPALTLRKKVIFPKPEALAPSLSHCAQ